MPKVMLCGLGSIMCTSAHRSDWLGIGLCLWQQVGANFTHRNLLNCVGVFLFVFLDNILEKIVNFNLATLLTQCPAITTMKINVVANNVYGFYLFNLYTTFMYMHCKQLIP